MTNIQAVLLGVLQGVAEFLPISSSGHLAIAESLFGLDEVPLLFDISLHVATLLAVCIFFWKQIYALLCVFGRFIIRKSKPEDKSGLTTIVALIAGTCVTGVMGIVVKKFLPDMPIKLICVGFIVTAVLLVVSSVFQKKTEQTRISSKAVETNTVTRATITDDASTDGMSASLSVKQGLLLGFAQGIGTLPGISRSGITISGGLFAGLNRTAAGEFSFILSIPAILGAFLLEVKDIGEVSSTIGIAPVLIGCACAFIVGFASLKFLMSLIKKGKLEWFAFYLIPIAILGFIFL